MVLRLSRAMSLCKVYRLSTNSQEAELFLATRLRWCLIPSITSRGSIIRSFSPHLQRTLLSLLTREVDYPVRQFVQRRASESENGADWVSTPRCMTRIFTLLTQTYGTRKSRCLMHAAFPLKLTTMFG